jgi:DNA-binding NarL/FixJ family response regulator
VVEDHPLYRKALVSVFSMLSYVKKVDEAEHGLMGLDLLARNGYDALFLDIQMPQLDGIATLKEIRAQWPDLKVIVLTQFDDPKFYRTMMAMGANGYLLKSTTEEELVEAFEAIYFGDEILVSNELESKMEQLATDGTAQLGPRELEVLTLLSDGMSSQEIAEHLRISWHTVSNHRKAIKRKVGVHSMADLIQWARDNNVF